MNTSEAPKRIIAFLPYRRALRGRCPACDGLMDQTGCRIEKHFLVKPAARRRTGVAQVVEVWCAGTPAQPLTACPCCSAHPRHEHAAPPSGATDSPAVDTVPSTGAPPMNTSLGQVEALLAECQSEGVLDVLATWIYDVLARSIYPASVQREIRNAILRRRRELAAARPPDHDGAA